MEESRLTGFRGVWSGFVLKRIAVASMIIDHFGSIVMDGVLAPYRVDGAITFTADMPFFIRYAPFIKELCEILGSVAFPLFCFLLVEGFLHTHDRMRYSIRLGVFALVSEVPFDIAHFGKAFDFSLQNVLFTLYIGICVLLLLNEVERRCWTWWRARMAWRIIVIAAGMGLAFLVRSEYVFLGVLTVALLYLLRKNRYVQMLGFLPLLAVSPWTLLALVPVFLYDGLRGKGSQYFFYVFYPAHFLLFAGLSYLLAQRPI